MTVNMWKSYIWTTDKGMNMKEIFAVMNTSCSVVKIRPEKNNSGLYRIPGFGIHCSSSVHYCEDLFHIQCYQWQQNLKSCVSKRQMWKPIMSNEIPSLEKELAYDSYSILNNKMCFLSFHYTSLN